MATRFYFNNASATFTPSTAQGTWDGFGTVQIALGLSKAGAASTSALAETTATNLWDVILLQATSEPLAAYTFTGTETAQWILGAKESSTSMNAFYHVHIYVTAGDTNTVRFTLLSNSIGATEWPTTATGRGEGAKTLTAGTMQDGDRIVVEVGYQAQNTVTTSFTGTLNYGGTGATDLASASTAVTTNPGWIEFSPALPLKPTIGQTSFRFYNDDVETAANYLGAINGSITQDVTTNFNLLLRTRLQESAGSSGASTDDYQLQYSLNSGSYFNINSAPFVDGYMGVTDGTASSIYDATHTKSGQTFAGDGSTIGSVSFNLAKVGSPTGNAVASIYATSGTYGTTSAPTGSALATSDSFDVSTLSTTAADTVFTFSGGNQITLTSGTKYAAVVEYTLGSLSNRIILNGQGNVVSGTHAGNMVGNGSGFGAGFDSFFAVYKVGAVAPVISYNSANLTDGGATTNRLGAGTGSFVAGQVSEDGLVDNHQLTASNYTEHLYSLTIVSSAVADTDTLDFRVLRNGAALDSYTVTPRITVSKSSGVVSTPNFFLFF